MSSRGEEQKKEVEGCKPHSDEPYDSKTYGLHKAFPKESLSQEFSEQNPVRGKHERFSGDSPLRIPPSRSNEGVVQKNISLSILPQQVDNTLLELGYGRRGNGETIEKKEEEEGIERYKSCNSVIGQVKVKRYRKNAIRNRCRQFARDLEDHGFQAGNKFDRRELRYWIIALDLAHDKTTVKQYLERLLIYGYFILNKHGKYVFCGSLKPGQLTFMDHRKVRAKIHMSLHQDRRIKRRSY